MSEILRQMADLRQSELAHVMDRPLRLRAATAGAMPTASDVEAPPRLDLGVASYRRSSGRYLLRADGGELRVERRGLDGTVDVRAGGVGPASIVDFADRRVGLLTPIVLDLDGDGIELRRRKKSKAAFDMDGDGRRDDTGWVAKDDGILVLDRNGDGLITSASELSFLGELEDAASSLHGLTKLDANRDGIVDAGDVRFAELKIWVDRNGDGVSQAGELNSLADQGIKSLSLDAVALSTSVKVGSNAVFTTSTFTRSDGSIGSMGDVVLAFRPSASPQPATVAEPLDPEEGRELRDLSPGFDLVEPRFPPSHEIDPQIGFDSSDLSVDRFSDSATASVATAHMPVADYEGIVQSYSARLIQAMGSFNSGASSKFASMRMIESADAPAWVTIAGLPSVERYLTV